MGKATVNNEVNSKKRKKKSPQQPPSAKRHKSEYSERFKFVLAPSSESDDAHQEVPPEKPKIKKKKSDLSKIFESPSDSDSSMSEDEDSWLDEDMESLSEEEEGSEEWETDTDYSEDHSGYSFHEGDCDAISDDSDYVPPIEDRYIKKGEAVIYDAKGLEFAFGDTNDSQIIEINDLNIDFNDDEKYRLLSVEMQKKNPPMLVDENGCEVAAAATSKSNEKEEDKDEDEIAMEFSQLLKRVTFYDCVDDQGVVICLNKTIHFLGILEVRPLLNSAQVNGFTIETGNSLKVTSISHANYYLNLSPVINGCEDEGLLEELKNLVPESADDIMSKLDRQKDVLIHLKQGLPDTVVELLKISCPFAILPHKNMILKNSVCSSSELILSSKFFVSEENPRLNCFRVNEDWKYIEMKIDSRIVVVGGKNTGKSSLAQYLINQNVSKFGKILLIDFDIGQPICGISQTLSATIVTEPIIGAGYFNSNLKQVKSFLFGDKSITNAPFKYVECARLLIDYCQSEEELRNIPWVINTLGYQKGFGIQLLTVILRLVQPSDVVQIQHLNAKYNFDCIVNENVVNKSALTFFEGHHVRGISKVYFLHYIFLIFKFQILIFFI